MTLIELNIAAIRVEATTNHHHLRNGKIYLFSSIGYYASNKSCCKFLQSSYHLTPLVMPLRALVASLSWVFGSMPQTKPRAYTSSDEYA